MNIDLLQKCLKSKQLDTVEFSVPELINSWNFSSYYSICSLNQADVQISVGYGVDVDQKLSQVKAFMESVERFATESCEKSFNGVAAHWLPWRASNSAYAEALERDAALRWMLGLVTPSQSEFIGNSFILEIPTLDVSYHLVIVGIIDDPHFACIPMGMGCGQSVDVAKTKAKNELLLAVRRHAARSCEHDNTLYGQLHSRTNSKVFRDFIKNFECGPGGHGNRKGQNSNYIGIPRMTKKLVKVEKISGLHKFPIQVFGVYSKSLLWWDLNWMLNFDQLSPNSQLLNGVQLADRLPFLVTG